jgi:drug/metabolite transporter (DMT)-like permease
MMLALGSAMFLSERLKPLEWGMLVLSGIGALLIALSKANTATGPQPTTRGDLLVLVSLVASVVMMLITKRVVERHDPMHFTACMIILGTIFLVLWVELFKPVRFHFSVRAWIAVALQGLLATAGAYLLWNWGVSRVPVSRAGVFLNLEPVVGATLGVWLLGETLGTAAIAGGLMIIGSAIYFSRRMPA